MLVINIISLRRRRGYQLILVKQTKVGIPVVPKFDICSLLRHVRTYPVFTEAWGAARGGGAGAGGAMRRVTQA